MTSYNREVTSWACLQLNIFSPLYPRGRYRWRRSRHQTWPRRTSGRWSGWPLSCSSAGSCVWKSPSGPVRWMLGMLAASSIHREQQLDCYNTFNTVLFQTKTSMMLHHYMVRHPYSILCRQQDLWKKNNIFSYLHQMALNLQIGLVLFVQILRNLLLLLFTTFS